MTDKTILLVEDDPNDLLLEERALADIRIANRVEVARDGDEALDRLLGRGSWEGQALSPVVVLLDLGLPRVSGLEVLRRIRADERTRRVPVVVLTSSSEERDLVRSYDLGANSYVVKPIDLTAFSQSVVQLGLYWVLLNERPQTTPRS